MKEPLFTLGENVATPGALVALLQVEQSPSVYLELHQTGDQGVLCDEDHTSNQRDIAEGNGRVFSAYQLPDGVKIWIITNLVDVKGVDTCILLPSEY